MTHKSNELEGALLNPTQAAKYLGVTAGTLSVWRCTNKVSIPYIKIGSKVMYRKSELDAFIDANTVRQEAA